jgi:hypothetical protein
MRRGTLGSSLGLILLLGGCSTSSTAPVTIPTSVTPPPHVDSIRLTPSGGGQIPAGGGTVEIVVETVELIPFAAVPNVSVALTATSGALSASAVTTDASGHAKVTWTGASPATITASAGDAVGATAVSVPSSTPPATATPVPQPAPAPNPTPTSPPAPGPGPLFVDILADPRLTDTVTPVHFSASVRPQNLDPLPTGLTYAWDFDEDGQTDSTAATPTYLFTHGKNDYAVVLTVHSADGRRGRGIVHVVVGAMPAPGVAVSVNATPNPAALNGIVTFTATAMPNSTGGSVTQYEWDFDGDGVADLTTTGSSVTQSYAMVGTKTVGVTVRSTTASGHGSGSVDVTAPALSVQLDASSTTPAPGMAITLTAAPAVAAGPLPAVSYTWDFGDGSTPTPTSATTAHTFAVKGIYTVRVTITAADGRTATSKLTITVS